MNRNDVKSLKDVILAFTMGKKVQSRPIGSETEWVVDEKPTFNSKKYEYRVMPEPKYRPFTTEAECWNEMLKHQPFGWVENDTSGERTHICTVKWSPKAGPYVVFSGNESFEFSVNIIFRDYTFVDGAPFGVIDESYE